jgi:hypothetical protein
MSLRSKVRQINEIGVNMLSSPHARKTTASLRREHVFDPQCLTT